MRRLLRFRSIILKELGAFVSIFAIVFPLVPNASIPAPLRQINTILADFSDEETKNRIFSKLTVVQKFALPITILVITFVGINLSQRIKRRRTSRNNDLPRKNLGHVICWVRYCRVERVRDCISQNCSSAHWSTSFSA
jgi:hypothetical protein